jgi:hypothetical protein
MTFKPGTSETLLKILREYSKFKAGRNLMLPVYICVYVKQKREWTLDAYISLYSKKGWKAIEHWPFSWHVLGL